MSARNTILSIAMTVFCGLSLWAQKMESTVYRYHVPLAGTKNVAIVDWNFLLEAVPQNELLYNAQVIQYDIRGRELTRDTFVAEFPNEVLRWTSTTQAFSNRLRSLEIVSDQPLDGVLWMSNDLLGQLNGVSLTDQLSKELTVTYIPEQFYEMTTSFAVQGVADGNQRSDISLYLFDQSRNVQEPVRIRSNWPTNGYFITTPEVTLALGGLGSDVVPAWGSIRSSQEGYLLSGFQTFSVEALENGVNQSAAVEMSSAGMIRGHLLFSESLSAEAPLEHQVIFTNPHAHSVNLDLTLFYSAYESRFDQDVLANTQSSITLLPYERRALTLGVDVFNESELPQTWLRMAFETSQPEDETLATDVFALHFQRDIFGAMSAANVLQEADEVSSWLTIREGMDFGLEISSLGTHVFKEEVSQENTSLSSLSLITEASVIDVTGSNEKGAVFTIRHTIDAGQRYLNLGTLNEDIVQIINESSNQALKITISLVEGPRIIAKLQATSENDFAVINPKAIVRPEVVEEVPEP